MRKGFNEEKFIKVIKFIVILLVIALYILGFIYMVGD